MSYRWDLFVKAGKNGGGHSLTAGPGFGLRANFETPVFVGPTDYPYHSTSIDTKASLEYVYWIAKHFGLTAQFDLSLSYMIVDITNAA